LKRSKKKKNDKKLEKLVGKTKKIIENNQN